MNHPLHEKIGNLIETHFQDYRDLKIVKDPACCGGEKSDLQHIPLFRSDKKSRQARYCCVDMLILQKGKTKGIIEIEEANIKPPQVCGKFLTSALSKFYIHKRERGSIEMADSVFFIQVLDARKLKEGSVKHKQFMKLEEDIQKIIPLEGSSICHYRLFVGTSNDYFEDMILFIKAQL